MIENCESPDGLFPETWPYDTSTAWQVVNYTDSGPESINAQFTNDPNYDPNIKDSDVVDFFTYPITEDGPQCLSKVGNQDVAELEPSQALLQCADLVREIVDTLDCAN